jgi:hypothetical protein
MAHEQWTLHQEAPIQKTNLDVDVDVDVDWGRGHTPRLIAAGPSCSTIYFRPSSPEALHVMRHERPLSAKDGITGEKWPVNLTCDPDFHVNHRVL